MHCITVVVSHMSFCYHFFNKPTRAEHSGGLWSVPLGQMTQLCELINKSGDLLAKNLSHLDTVLGALDVQEHSLGVLAVL